MLALGLHDIEGMKALNSLKLAVAVLGLAGAVAAVGLIARDPEIRVLEKRAERVFQYDRQFGGKLPAHEVRALSMALVFHDHKGAEKLLNKLEHLSNL